MTPDELRRAGIIDTQPLPAAIIVIAALAGWAIIIWGLIEVLTCL